MGAEPSCRAGELLGLKVGRPWEGHNISLCGHPPSADMSHSVHMIGVETLGACIRCELFSGVGSGPCWGLGCLASKALGSVACAQ